MRLYSQAFEIVKEISKSDFEGRIADGGISLAFLMSMVANAEDGDHLEIGTLFGASAIAVARMKQELGHEGRVYCIDPYDEEERRKNIQPVGNTDPEILSANREALMRNAEAFDVELTLVEEYSNPWPEELADNTFVTAYIDGDHQHDMPYTDFQNLRERVSDYIGFDNYEEGYPDVMGAVQKILSEDEDWTIFYKNATFLAMRRRLPARNSGNTPLTAL